MAVTRNSTAFMPRCAPPESPARFVVGSKPGPIGCRTTPPAPGRRCARWYCSGWDNGRRDESGDRLSRRVRLGFGAIFACSSNRSADERVVLYIASRLPIEELGTRLMALQYGSMARLGHRRPHRVRYLLVVV